MLMVRDDLEFLEIHAGIIMAGDKDKGFQWRCIYTKALIQFVRQYILVDYGLFKKKVEIDRPYCPKCSPGAQFDNNKFITLAKPYPYSKLVSVPED